MPQSFQNMLNEVASVAIWDKNKIAVSSAIIVWGINAAFYIQSGSLFLISSREFIPYFGMVGSQVLSR
jgi:uncharacterized membrane protein